MDKNSFLIYLDYEEQFNLLTDEQLGQLMRAIIKYEKTKNTPKLEGVLKMAFSFIKTQLDRDREKYVAKCEKNKENGAKGGRPKKKQTDKEKPNGFQENPTKPKKADKDKEDEEEIDNEEEILKGKNKKRKTFDDIFKENSFSEDLETTLKDFIDMRKTIKKPMTSKALELLIKNLDRLTNLEEEKIAILNQSIEHSWQTVYPLKNKANAEEEFLNE